MNGKQLKNSILQWAIQGKLVPQDPNDEPASVLLEKIRAEKTRLVKEGKLKKKDLEVKPIEEDEVPFEIPKGWELVRLKTISDKIVDGDHNPPHGLSFDSGYYMLSSKNINHDTIECLDDVRYMSIVDWSKSNERTNLKKGDILLTTVATLGRSCVYENDVPYCFQRSVSVIHTFVYNYFLKYCFDSPYYQSLIDEKATGTAQKGFYLNQLEESIIPLPPLAEQHRIVAKIEELMPLVEKYGETQEALEEWNNSLPEKLKKSILQEAIQGKLVLQDPNEGIAEISNSYKVPRKTSNFDDYLFEIPEKWKWCKLFQIADVIGGYAFQSGDLKSNNGIRVIRISDITPKGLSNKSVVRCSLREIPDQYSIKCNDILIAMTGGTVGKSLLLKSMTEPMYLNQRVAIIRASKDVDVEYLNLVIKSPLIQSIISDVKNSTNDNISMADITGFPFPLPPLAEQRRIVSKIEELFGVIKK